MTPQELKNSILQLAIQGKLVEQRPEEGTAAELLEKILATKNAKSAKKNLTRSRGARGENKTSATSASPREKIPDDEKPFDIPESWEWVRNRDVMRFINGRAYTKTELLNKGKYRVLRVGNFFTNDSWYYSDLELDEDKYCDNGDLLYAWSASFGPKIWIGNKVIFHYHIWKLDYYRPICREYLYYYLLADTFRIRNLSHGLGFVFVTKKFMEERPLPLPPLAEQKRIVVKIEELLPLIDRYEKAWSKLEDFNKRFPVDMQKSLLQMAIQGKLVDHRPEEGTGEELLEKILAAKNAKGAKKNLTRSRGARGEKSTSALSASPREVIPDDEKPFDIPEGWVWVRLGEIFTTSSGTTPSKSKPEYYLTPDYNWIRTTDLNNSVLQSCEIKISQKAFEDCRLSIIPQNSVCVAMYGGAGTIGKNAIIKFDTTINQSVCAIQPNGFCEMLFVQRFLQFYRPCWMKMAAGSRKDPNISQVIIKNALFPLPPLAEQKRIVAKLEELLPLCERLK